MKGDTRTMRTRSNGPNETPTGGEAETSTGAATSATPAHPADPNTVDYAPSAAGADGKPKRLHTTGMTDAFGPVKVGDTEYTITRSGIDVPGEHVEAVRDAAKHAHVKLRSTAAKS